MHKFNISVERANLHLIYKLLLKFGYLMYFSGKENRIQDCDESKCGMQDFPEKGMGMEGDMGICSVVVLMFFTAVMW